MTSGAGITVNYVFALLSQIPEQRPAVEEMVRFAIDHTLILNIAFLVIAAVLLWLAFGQGTRQRTSGHRKAHAQHSG